MAVLSSLPLLGALLQLAGAPDIRPAATPEAVVQAQVDAYNAHDIEGFLATYADDAEIYQHPSTLLVKGKTQLRERYTRRLAEPGLHATIAQRMLMGDTVVDREHVTRTAADGSTEVLDAVVIYEVQAAHIVRSWLLIAPRTPAG